jgi:CheY-like chemotaxis protein
MVVEMGRPGDLLIAEDNPGDIERIEEAVADAGPELSTHVVSDGDEAKDFVFGRCEYDDATDPDAVVLDWNIPGTDGERVLDELKADRPELPVVVVTSLGVEKAALESKAVHTDAVVEKSADPDVYAEAIQSVAGNPV